MVPAIRRLLFQRISGTAALAPTKGSAKNVIRGAFRAKIAGAIAKSLENCVGLEDTVGEARGMEKRAGAAGFDI